MLSRSKDNKNVEVTSRIIMLTKMKEDNFSRMIKLGVRFEKRVSPVEKYYFTFKRLNYSFIFTKHEILNVYIQMILVVNLEYYISFRTSITSITIHSAKTLRRIHLIKISLNSII